MSFWLTYATFRLETMVSSRSNQFTLSYKSFGEYGDWRGLSSTPPPQNARKNQNKSRKNGSHKMAIVREPCNVDTHANIPALFKIVLYPDIKNKNNKAN